MAQHFRSTISGVFLKIYKQKASAVLLFIPVGNHPPRIRILINIVESQAKWKQGSMASRPRPAQCSPRKSDGACFSRKQNIRCAGGATRGTHDAALFSLISSVVAMVCFPGKRKYIYPSSAEFANRLLFFFFPFQFLSATSSNEYLNFICSVSL